MSSSDSLLPNMNDGRFFVSPVLGCNGACCYCYLSLHDYKKPHINVVSIAEILTEAQNNPDFIWGEKGTIISVGAWGDIFPIGNDELIAYSVKMMTGLLSWGNPVQIMSKNFLAQKYVDEIAKAVLYPGQLLYSTTITTLRYWEKIEPFTSCPNERLDTCMHFHKNGVPTNVLLKPFFSKLTGVEIEGIAEILLKFKIDFCTVGVLYWDPRIAKRIASNPFLKELVDYKNAERNHLDCDGYAQLCATEVNELMVYVDYLNKKGIRTFLKSSCVNANILKEENHSHYYLDKDRYCINCGNCAKENAQK